MTKISKYGIKERLPIALILSIVLILVSVQGSGAFADTPETDTASAVIPIDGNGTGDGGNGTGDGNGTGGDTGGGDNGGGKVTTDNTAKELPKTKIKKITVAKKSIKLTFIKVDKALKITQYQIQYRIKGQKKWQSKNIKVKYTGATTAKITIKKLKAKKRYQFKVRAWQTTGQTNNYAKWSPIKTSGKVKG